MDGNAVANGNAVAIQNSVQNMKKMESEFAKALPFHVPVKKFMRTAQTAISLTKNINKLTDQRSLMAACSQAAADGLIFDGREAALIINYKGEAEYRPMLRGLLKLAHNSGELKSLVVETVCEHDLFDYSPSRPDEPIVHKIDLRSKRGDVYAAYAMAVLKSGGIVFEVMTADDINAIRDRSDAYKAFNNGKIKSTPWHTDWSEMARKTVFRRLSKYLPSSTDREDRLHSAAERIDDDFDFQNDNAPEQPQGHQPKKRGAGAAAFNSVEPEPGHHPETGEIIDADYREVPDSHPNPDADPTPEAGDDI